MSKGSFLLVILLVFCYEAFARTTRPPPPPPLECYKCNSDDLPECATKPSEQLPHSKCKHFREQCVTVIIDEVTLRGCSGELQIPIDVELFTYCNSTLCNKEIYPPGRRKCYQCEGSDCIDNFENTLQPCTNYVKGDFCVTDVIDETDVVRGCLSDSNYSAGPFAQLCELNGCNNHQTSSELECLSCSSESDRNCVRNPAGRGTSCNISVKKTCKVSTLLGRDSETCFIYHKYGKVIRGCTRYGGKLQLEEKFFNTCEGQHCNKKCVSDRKCVVCDSAKDPKCANQTEELTLQTCPRVSFCHSCAAPDGIIKRGCGDADSLEGCYRCQDSDGCNAKNFLKCFNCTSDDDPNCAQWTDPTKIRQEICSNPDDSCLVAVRTDGHTIRGCSSAKRPCGRNTKCKHCVGNLCNGGIFPEDRQLCYHCQDAEKCRESPNDNKLIPCKKYTRRGGCFQYVNKYHEMVRGCRSDEEYKSCIALEDMCLACSESGCNNRPAVRTANISCASCTETHNSCPWSQKPETAVKCTQDVPYHLNETCFTRVDKNGTISRGCSSGKDACTDDYKKCLTCDFNRCNIQRMKSQSCIHCQSNATGQATCANFSEGIPPKICTANVQYYENRGCYVKRDGDVISRGCTTDLSEEEQRKCKQKDPFCYYCEGENCNTLSAPNQVGVVNTLNKLYIVVFLFTVTFL